MVSTVTPTSTDLIEAYRPQIEGIQSSSSMGSAASATALSSFSLRRDSK